MLDRRLMAHIGCRRLHLPAPGHSPLSLAVSGGRMEWTIIAMNVVYAVLGVVIMFISYRVIDRLTPQVDFADELRKGNLAVAVFIGAIFIAIALIIAGALN
jgi:uncharacterized membrane protein YjfL (UPF0719 family)